MPGAGPSSNGDYYCDANNVGGQSCSEMDLVECNRHACQITPHRCTGGTTGCDSNGCAKNTQSISNGFGPGTSFTINTLSSFTVCISFAYSGSTLTGITSVFSQGSNSITLTHGSECGSGYLTDMGNAISKGMVPVWTYWTGSMGWLDSPACTSDTPEVTGSFTFSNLQIYGSLIGGSTPPSAPTVPPTAPTPKPPTAPSSSVVCGTSGCTTNTYWVEFKPPNGVDGSSTPASVKCGSATFSCSWYAAGGKYQCSTSSCPSPQAFVGSNPCTFSSSAVEDSLATTGSSSQPLVIGLSVGLGVAILIIIALIAGILIKKNAAHYEETV
jgi:hypothetical protein